MRRYGADRQLVLPLLLILIGVLFLLGNFGLFNRVALWRLGDLWPLVLVLIGGLLIINRALPPASARLASMVLLAVLVIGAAVYVAASPIVPGGSKDFSGPLGSESKAQLRLEFGASSVEVRAESLGDNLYQAHVDYSSGEEAPTATFDRETGVVAITQNAHFNPFAFSSRSDRVQVRLTDHIPWAIQISGGAAQMTIDLSHGHLAKAEIAGGANSMNLTLPAPQGTVSVSIAGGANELRIRVASGSAARIQVTGGVGTLEVNGSRQSGIGQLTWATSGYDSASDRYDIQISGGASTVTLDTR